MIDKSLNLQNLEIYGEDFARQILYEERKIEVTYNKKMIQIAKRKNGGVYYLDLNEPCRILVIGMNGSGKTWFSREILNRLKKAGMSVFIPTDIKDEFYSNRYKLQPKFHRLLLPGEEPTNEKIMVLRPTFFKTTTPELKKNTYNIWYSPDLTQMNKDDFLTFFNIDDLKAPQKACLEFLWSKLVTYLKGNAESFHFELFNEWLGEMPGINSSTRNSMTLRFMSLHESHFYEPQHKLNLAHKIKEGNTISINLEGYESFLKGNFLHVHGIIGMTIRELIAARRRREISRIMILLEESPRFIANTMPTSSVKKITEESFDVDRRYGVDWMVITQDMSQMSEKIINQSRYLFVPANIPLDPFVQCFTSFGMANSSQNSRTEAMRLHKQMSHSRHEWMVFDRNTRTATVVSPLAPLCEHAEAIE